MSRRPYLREWLTLACALLLFTGLASQHAALERLDHLVQDLGSRLLAPAASPDIALVALDERSIAAIGRWPWRRALHAELIAQITRQNPRAIGLDILLGEADTEYPEDDAVLASAIARSAQVVLPVARGSREGMALPDLPLPLFREAAREIGHVQVQVDSDGIARGMYTQEGPADAPWPTFATALRCAGGLALPACLGNSADAAQGPWVRRMARRIAFASGTPAFPTWSYIDVLTGKVAGGTFTGKYVLVGATATGLGDLYAAPTASGSRRIAGVQLLAHALNTELSGVQITPASAWTNTVLQLALVGAALLSLWFLGPLGSLLACTLIWLLTLLLTLLAPSLAQTTLAPAAALVGILAAYPLWSWRRLSFATRFLQRELAALRADGITTTAPVRRSPLGTDKLGQRIRAVEGATQQLRTLHRFITGSLEHLPSPTFVCDDQGRITLATRAAHRFAAPGHTLLCQALPAVLAHLVHPDTQRPLLPTWPPPATDPRNPLEGRDDAGRRWLMLANTFVQDARGYWLITLVDLTDMREAQEQRDQALRFISHDLRSPASSILTLLEMQHALPDALPEAQLHARIASHARMALTMAQDFTELASAQTQPLQRTPLDLVVLLQEATQQAWAGARKKQVRITIAEQPFEAPCEGDRQLLVRAIGNLLGNAIKFTAEGSQVVCSLRGNGRPWRLSVRDQGPGISAEQQQRVFQPFERLHRAGAASTEGYGLGLAFVHEAMRRHGGSVQLESDGMHGSTFTLVLPGTQDST